MTPSLSRRTFVRVATATVAGMALPRALFGEDPVDKPLYAFPLIGDLHYDRLAHHDLDWVKKEKPGDLRQIEGYVRTTEQFTPTLLADVAQTIKQMKANGTPVPFVLQIGDLVEGLCGSFDLQSLQFRDAMAAIEKADLGAPMLVVKGNHDVTGPGAPEAFDKVLLPWIAGQAKQELRSASYAWWQGEHLFVAFDAYKPDLDWLARTLQAKGNRARRLFFAIHPPVVPYNARADWHIYAKGKGQEQRERLLSLLGSHHAIVLGGHLHKYSLLSRRTDAGSIVQLAVSSVVRAEREAPRDELEGIGRYGPDLVKLEPKHAPETVEARRQLLQAEKPFISRFEYADTAGYAIVKVFASRVDVEMYAGVGNRAWKSRQLSPTGQP